MPGVGGILEEEYRNMDQNHGKTTVATYGRYKKSWYSCIRGCRDALDPIMLGILADIDNLIYPNQTMENKGLNC